MRDDELAVLLSVLILFVIGIVVWMMIIVATRRRRPSPELASLGVFTEPEANLARDRLRSLGCGLPSGKSGALRYSRSSWVASRATGLLCWRTTSGLPGKSWASKNPGRADFTESSP